MPDLLTPLALGPHTLKNRVILAPMTRCRAGAGYAPTALNAAYYAQRAGGGLLITEATQISQVGMGYPNTPGIYSDAQVAGWKLVTSAVHKARGLIYAQLWHVGRSSHNAFQPGGAPPVSSSAIAKSGECTLPDFTKAPFPVPHALTIDEIRATIADYRHAAECALKAGFDGVELHGANGYLPDQFLRDGVNQRTDQYGGSIENRARFHLEAAKALIDVWGPARVGVRLSPSGTFNDMRDSRPHATFGYLVKALDALNVGYLHIMEAAESDRKHAKELDPAYEPIPISYFRPMYRGVLIANSGFTYQKAQDYLAAGHADAVAFGVPFLANPDLPERFQRFGAAAPLNTPDPSTFYMPGEKGYTDYPALGHAAAR